MRWSRPLLLILLLALTSLGTWRALSWLASDPPADYCYFDNGALYAHRPWHKDRGLGRWTHYTAEEVRSFAEAFGCKLELR